MTCRCGNEFEKVHHLQRLCPSCKALAALGKEKVPPMDLSPSEIDKRFRAALRAIRKRSKVA